MPRNFGFADAYCMSFRSPSAALLWWMMYSAHILQKDIVPDNYDKKDPEHKTIYRFIRTLFNAAQLTAECAIVTLVSLRACAWGHVKTLATKILFRFCKSIHKTSSCVIDKIAQNKLFFVLDYSPSNKNNTKRNRYFVSFQCIAYSKRHQSTILVHAL